MNINRFNPFKPRIEKEPSIAPDDEAAELYDLIHGVHGDPESLGLPPKPEGEKEVA